MIAVGDFTKLIIDASNISSLNVTAMEIFPFYLRVMYPSLRNKRIYFGKFCKYISDHHQYNGMFVLFVLTPNYMLPCCTVESNRDVCWYIKGLIKTNHR